MSRPTQLLFQQQITKAEPNLRIRNISTSDHVFMPGLTRTHSRSYFDKNEIHISRRLFSSVQMNSMKIIRYFFVEECFA